MPIAHATFDVPARSHASSRLPSALDDLLALDAPELDALYRGAAVPDLAVISGDLKGRMLALPALRPPVATAIRAFASSSRFPWRGKSFTPLGAGRGEGINRVIRDRWKLYRFETFVGPSRGGNFDAVQLDYDLSTNPFFIRPIKDEIRELSPGLYLGQAYLQRPRKAHLVLYFGLTSR
jgi:hypothetical protein